MLRRRLFVLLLLVTVPPCAAAQTVTGQEPKAAFEISGWRYQVQGPNRDVHSYSCEAQCNPTSKVSYHLYDNTLTMTQDQFRSQQRDAVKMLEGRMQPGGKVGVVSIEEDRKDGIRVLKAQRLHSYANGRKEHVISAFVFGAPQPFSLISSADDEKSVISNFALFLPRILLVVKVGAPKQ